MDDSDILVLTDIVADDMFPFERALADLSARAASLPPRERALVDALCRDLVELRADWPLFRDAVLRSGRCILAAAEAACTRAVHACP